MLQTWEEAIKYCKELADQYEKETFQYIELGQILVSLSETLYTSYKYTVRFTDIFIYRDRAKLEYPFNIREFQNKTL